MVLAKALIFIGQDFEIMLAGLNWIDIGYWGIIQWNLHWKLSINKHVLYNRCQQWNVEWICKGKCIVMGTNLTFGLFGYKTRDSCV